jgi:ferredoxin
MKLKIDVDACYCSGECYYNHPKLFKMDEDGFPETQIVELTTDRDKLEAEQAIEVCPSAAISVED